MPFKLFYLPDVFLSVFIPYFSFDGVRPKSQQLLQSWKSIFFEGFWSFPSFHKHQDQSLINYGIYAHSKDSKVTRKEPSLSTSTQLARFVRNISHFCILKFYHFLSSIFSTRVLSHLSCNLKDSNQLIFHEKQFIP